MTHRQISFMVIGERIDTGLHSTLRIGWTRQKLRYLVKLMEIKFYSYLRNCVDTHRDESADVYACMKITSKFNVAGFCRKLLVMHLKYRVFKISQQKEANFNLIKVLLQYCNFSTGYDKTCVYTTL